MAVQLLEYHSLPQRHKRTNTTLYLRGMTQPWLLLLVGCLTSQQHTSVSQGRICSDKSLCCHTEIKVADQTLHLTQSQYTDTGPTSPSTDPVTPGTREYQIWGHWYDLTQKNPHQTWPKTVGSHPSLFLLGPTPDHYTSSLYKDVTLKREIQSITSHHFSVLQHYALTTHHTQRSTPCTHNSSSQRSTPCTHNNSSHTEVNTMHSQQLITHRSHYTARAIDKTSLQHSFLSRMPPPPPPSPTPSPPPTSTSQQREISFHGQYAFQTLPQTHRFHKQWRDIAVDSCLSSLIMQNIFQGWICEHKSISCHTDTDIEVADQAYCLTKPRYSDTGPTSPSTEKKLQTKCTISPSHSIVTLGQPVLVLKKSQTKHTISPSHGIVTLGQPVPDPMMPDAQQGRLQSTHCWVSGITWPGKAGFNSHVLPPSLPPTLAADALPWGHRGRVREGKTAIHSCGIQQHVHITHRQS